MALVLRIASTAERCKRTGERYGHEVFENCVHVDEKPGCSHSSISKIDGSGRQNHARKRKCRLVPLVEPARSRVRQGLTPDESAYLGEPTDQVAKPLHDARRDVRDLDQPFCCGAEELIFGDVDVVLVVPDLERDRESGPNAQLVSLTKATAHHELG